MLRHGFAVFCLFILWLAGDIAPASAQVSSTTSQPLVVGETFTLDSKRMGETRRINVYLPPGYDERADAKVPVLYMPDGGIAEDFLHVAGLMQVSMANGTMRPFMLVGIENTQRRRDMTVVPTPLAVSELSLGGSFRCQQRGCAPAGALGGRALGLNVVAWLDGAAATS